MKKSVFVLCVLFGLTLVCAATPSASGRRLLDDDDNDNDDDDDDDDDSAPAVSGTSVLNTASQLSDLSVFYRAAANAGLNDTLASTTVQATVFAPTNDAFDDFLGNFDLSRTQFISTPAFSKLVLQYHLVGGSALRASQLTDNQKLTTALNNYRVTVNTDRDDGDDDDSDIEIQAAHSDAEIQRADIVAGQAIVHTVGSVLIPPLGFWLPAVQGQTGTATPAAG